ncbi:hypothetical protein ACFQEX_27070 [Roseibium salinum]|nr:hypothetical protein [Roseibium salinum]
MVAFLSTAGACHGRNRSVETVETMAWVFPADADVHKMKKPERLPQTTVI